MHLIGPIRRWLADRFGWRYVILTDEDGENVLRRAYRTDAGWVAYRRLTGPLPPYELTLLRPEGRAEGPRYVATWEPVYGWSSPFKSPADALRALAE